MTKSKVAKKNMSISSERLTELRRKVLIESTGSSLRLSGSKLSDEQVEQISKSSGQK
ncbi:MAG: hypothetical protein Q8P52_03520 [bacterium]|nr:hypothetical protein [bacterium]